jgi:hypothetical protein
LLRWGFDSKPRSGAAPAVRDQTMADAVEDKRLPRKLLGPDLDQMAENLEFHARILQESFKTADAVNLRNWARELRREAVKGRFKGSPVPD